MKLINDKYTESYFLLFLTTLNRIPIKKFPKPMKRLRGVIVIETSTTPTRKTLGNII